MKNIRLSHITILVFCMFLCCIEDITCIDKNIEEKGKIKQTETFEPIDMTNIPEYYLGETKGE